MDDCLSAGPLVGRPFGGTKKKPNSLRDRQLVFIVLYSVRLGVTVYPVTMELLCC